MKAQEILQKSWTQVFGAAPPEERERTLMSIRGWDSVRMVHLIVDIEKQVGRRFTSAELVKLKTLQDLQTLIDTHLR